jgi:hypothetical protein
LKPAVKAEGEPVLRDMPASVAKSDVLVSLFPQVSYASYRQNVDRLLAQPNPNVGGRAIDVSWLWNSRRVRK